MRYLFTLILVCTVLSVGAQNHFVVEYDRLNDRVEYFQVFVESGEQTGEIPVKQIAVTEGDILQARMINVNELAFEVDLQINTISRPKSPGRTIAALITDVAGGSGVLGALGAIIDVSKVASTYDDLLRGSGDERSEDAKFAGFLAEIQLDLLPAEEYFRTLELDLPSAVGSVRMTKEEIIQELNKMESSADELDLSEVYENLESEISELEGMVLTSESVRPELMKSAQDLIARWEEIDPASFDPTYLNSAFVQAREELELVDFIHTEYYVVENLDEDKDDVLVDFKFSMSDEDDWFSDAVIYNHKLIRVKRKKSAVSIVNGLVANFPLSNMTSFDVQRNGDSVTFVSQEAELDFNFTTLVQYEFNASGAIVPSLNVGISLPIKNFTDTDLVKGMRIVTGVGLRFQRFSRLAFTASLAWGQINSLIEGLEYNSTYDVYDLDNQGVYDEYYSELEDSAVISKRSVGLSVGVAINLN